MAPYLDTVKSFADVPITEEGVETVSFIKAAEGLVGLFDILGSKAFAPVVSDLNGNIKKLQTRYDEKPEQSKTLELLVKNEQAEKKKTATEGLLWLLRGLSFTMQALQKTQADQSKELNTAFGESYEVTLKQYHNFVVKGVFGVALKAVPYRKDFYAKLAADPAGGEPASQERLDEAFNKWLTALAGIVTRLQAFYADNGYDKKL